MRQEKKFGRLRTDKMEKEYKTFKVEMDIETMQDIIEVFEHYRKQPCRRKVMWELPRRLSKIISIGCFKHNIFMDTFRVGPNETTTFCRKCSPKEYSKHKQREMCGDSYSI